MYTWQHATTGYFYIINSQKNNSDYVDPHIRLKMLVGVQFISHIDFQDLEHVNQLILMNKNGGSNKAVVICNNCQKKNTKHKCI